MADLSRFKEATAEVKHSPHAVSAWDEAEGLAAEEGGQLENADGNRARIRRLRPDKTLVLDWQSDDLEAGTQVEVLFQAKADKCGVVLNHTRIQDRARADAARAAWEDALKRLKEHIES